MPKLALYKQDGSTVGEIELTDSVFGIEPNEHVMHDAVVMHQASLRSGTHSTKNRSEVRGGGRKPWKQKGTGRARQGSIRSPQWVGGGVVFGPTPRKYGYRLPKKVRRLAIKSALSAKVASEQLKVVEDLSLDQIKTKAMIGILEQLNVQGKALIVTDAYNETIALSSRNIPEATFVTADNISVLNVLKHDNLIMTKDAVAKVEEVLR